MTTVRLKDWRLVFLVFFTLFFCLVSVGNMPQGEAPPPDLTQTIPDFLLSVALLAAVLSAHPVLFARQRWMQQVREREEEARRTVGNMRGLIEAAPVGVITVSKKFRLRDINQTLVRQTGGDPDDVRGRHIVELWPELGTNLLPFIREAFGSGNPVRDREVVGRLRPEEPEMRHWFASVYPAKDDAGSIIGASIGLSDVTTPRRLRAELSKSRAEYEETIGKRESELSQLVQSLKAQMDEREKTERALRQSEAQLRLITDNLPALICYVDVDQRYRFVNKVYEEWFGRPVAEFTGRTMREVSGDGVFSHAEPYVRKALSGEPVTYEVEAGEGKPHLQVSLVPFVGQYGLPAGFFGITTDITAQKRYAEQLRQSEEWFRNSFDFAASGMAVTNPRGELERANLALGRFLGWEPDELIGRPVGEYSFGGDWEGMQPLLDELRDGVRTNLQIEQRFRHRNGQIRWGHVAASVMRDPQGRADQMILQIIDTSELRQAQDAARLSRFTVESVGDAIAWVGPRGAILDVNEAACEMAGHSRASMVGAKLTDVVPELPHGSWKKQWTYLKRQGTAVLETNLKHRNGHMTPMEARANYLNFNGREYICLVARDITERKRSEAALLESEKQLRALTERLISAQEDERRSLARELHDDLNQRLAFMVIELEKTLGDVDADDPIRIRLMSIRDDLATLSDDIRRISHQLHPAALEHLGLAVALEAECERFGERESIPVRFDVDPLPDQLPRDVSLALYRIAQECLANISKHAEADSAAVSLRCREDVLRLEVSDTGQGFDLESLKGGRSLGLISMSERVRPIHGDLQLESEEGAGTRITVTVPLEAYGGGGPGGEERTAALSGAALARTNH